MTDQTFPTHNRPRYNLSLLFANPSFWSGAFETRKQVMMQAKDDYERSIHAAGQARIEAIADGLASGQALKEIPEFQMWLAGGKVDDRT